MDWRGGSESAAAAAADGADRLKSQEPLKVQAYDALVLDIIVGDFPASGRLDELALARKHRVGLAGVRDALNRLSLEGLVLRQPRSGTVVAPIELHEVQQCLEARMLLEPYVARLAARHASAGQVTLMRAAADAAGEAVRRHDYRMAVQSGRCFYRALGEAGGNTYLLRALLGLYTFGARLWMRSLPYRETAELMDDVARHLQLVEAIERRDGDGADRTVAAIIGALQQGVYQGLLEGRRGASQQDELKYSSKF